MALTLSQFASLAAAAAKKIDPNSSKELRRFSQVGVGLMKKEIQNVHAVDTSTMLNSTSAESVDKDTILIGPTVDYAAHVALGTSRVEARPFHITAATELNNQVKDFNLGDLGI